MSLSKNEQKIYELLKNRELYRNEKGIFTMCPRKYLILKSGKSEKTIKRALAVLEEQGYIYREWLAKEHLMLFYFLNEDFSERTIYDRYENDPHSGENDPHSDENDPHSDENDPHSGKNVTPSDENDPHSDKNRPHYTNCTANTKSHKKPPLPHIEKSAIMAERMFYTMPSSPANHFLFDILAAGEDIANLPARKKQVSHGTTYEVQKSQ